MSTLLAKNLQRSYGTMYYVSDMSKTISWYKEKLGLVPSCESPEWSEIPVSDHTICLHIIEPQQKTATSGFVILQVMQLQEIVQELAARGVYHDPIKEVHPGAYAVNIYDPDNNVLSLYQAPSYIR